jgi:predicted nucleic acid-binding protein
MTLEKRTLMETVYLETTIFSYLVARPSRDVRVAGHQQTTAEWWAKRRQEFICVVSDFLVAEIRRGDTAPSAERLRLAEGLPRLKTTQGVLRLAGQFVAAGALPNNAQGDALHLALAVAGGVNYLLTWNCTHLANAQLIGRMQEVASRAGWRLPAICTPDELMGD